MNHSTLEGVVHFYDHSTAWTVLKSFTTIYLKYTRFLNFLYIFPTLFIWLKSELNTKCAYGIGSLVHSFWFKHDRNSHDSVIRIINSDQQRQKIGKRFERKWIVCLIHSKESVQKRESNITQIFPPTRHFCPVFLASGCFTCLPPSTTAKRMLFYIYKLY